MSTDPNEVVVTLIHAAGDAPLASSLRERLRTAGSRARLVALSNADTRVLGQAIDAVTGHGLFVLCVAKQLDESTCRKIEGLFAARRGPLHRMIRVDLLGRSPVVLVTRIRAECEEVAKLHEQDDEDDESTISGLREVVHIGDRVAISLPAVRLAPNELLDGDTTRLELPDNAKSAELLRRRKAVKERSRSRARKPDETSSSSGISTISLTSVTAPANAPVRWDRNAILLLLGVAVLAILAALSLGGI